MADATGKDSVGLRPVLASDVDKLPELGFARLSFQAGLDILSRFRPHFTGSPISAAQRGTHSPEGETSIAGGVSHRITVCNTAEPSGRHMTAHQKLDVSASGLSAVEGLEPVADATGKDSVGLRPVLASDVDKLPELGFARLSFQAGLDILSRFRPHFTGSPISAARRGTHSPESETSIAGSVSHRITVCNTAEPSGRHMTAHQRLDVSASGLSAVEGLKLVADATGKDSVGLRPCHDDRGQGATPLR